MLFRALRDRPAACLLNVSPRAFRGVLTYALLAPVMLSAAATHAQSVQEGQTLFGARCYSCHNVGSGDKQGPDLKGVTARRTRDWLHEFVNGPAAMNAKGDATAKQLFTKFTATVMPDQALAPQQVDSILMMIEDLTNKNQVFVPAGAKLSRAILPADVDGGWKFFTGRERLRNGGAACISCHSIKGVGSLGGGTLGPDLTGVNLKYRDPELISILQNPNFPTMSTVFAAHALTDEEIVQLFALFQNAKQMNPMPASQAGVTTLDPRFFVIGSAAMLLVLMLLNLSWRHRLRGVREELVRTAIASRRLRTAPRDSTSPFDAGRSRP
jgi:mono/diheme cytochrome c family protein